MNKNEKRNFIFLLFLIFLPPLAIYFSHRYLPGNYFFSSLYKALYFTPLLWRFFIEKKSLKKSFWEGFDKKNFKIKLPQVISLSAVLSLIYASAFLIFEKWLDLNSIAIKINELINVGIGNIILIGLYIIFINSFLEEFFWRGFIFKKLLLFNRISAYLLSGFGFAIYHLMFFYNWFPYYYVLIAAFGLFFYAVIMNFVLEKHKTLFSCWLIHIAVDIVQIGIGLRIFGII